MMATKSTRALVLLPITLMVGLAGCDPHPKPVPEPKPQASLGQAVAESQRRPRPRATTESGFDYYLLNLSWSPEFCHSHPTNVQCAMHSTFVLHGLWPQNMNGTYPENCGRKPGPSNPSQYKDLYPDQGLLQHEWKAHGTCSGLTADAFFTTARKAVQSVKIPTKLSQLDHQISMPPDQILALFTAANPQIPRSSLAMSCGNNYLTAVEVCMDKDLKSIACGPVRSCRANTVKIPPPQ